MAAPTDPPAVTRAPALTDAIRAWSATHPQATFAEIEREVMRQVAALQTDLIATAVAARDPAAPPTCPTCGQAMGRNGPHIRTLVTRHQEEVTVQGQRYRCAGCGTELSPPR